MILRTEVESVRGSATTFWSGHGVTISGNMERSCHGVMVSCHEVMVSE